MILLKPLKSQFLGLQIPINNILLAFVTIYIFIICLLAYWIDPVSPHIYMFQLPSGLWSQEHLLFLIVFLYVEGLWIAL